MTSDKPKKKGRVYVIGASGRLGRAIISKIDAVPVVRRQSGLKEEVVSEYSRESLKKTLADASAIIIASGSTDTLDKKKMREANVDLTRKIVDAAPIGCRILFAGSVSVYGKSLERIPADERTPARPDSEYARSKYEAERIVASFADHVIFRIGPLYGPQFEDYNRVLSMLERGKMRIIGDGKNRVPFVHVDDVADAFRKALEKGSGVYVLAGESLTQMEILSIASSELSVESPRKRMPRAVAMLAAALSEIGYWFGGKRPKLTREHVAVLGYDRAFDCSKAKAELGFSPRPLEKGIREMVREYKKKR
ncbi:MAG: NAD-dependent epimerase/dehydratase family protein [Candidatus Micrarchaeota archaeon]